MRVVVLPDIGIFAAGRRVDQMTAILTPDLSQNSTEFDAQCALGCESFRKRRYSQALRHFENAVAVRPDEARARRLLGTTCAFLGDFKTAAIHFHRSTQIVPRESSGYLNLGAVLNMSKEFSGAIRVLKRGLFMTRGKTKFTEEFYFNMGIAYRNTDQELTALKCYLECLRLKPEMPCACINLANIYCRQQDFENALKYYSMVLDFEAENSKDHGRAMLGIKHVRALLAGDETPGMPVSSPGLVVKGAVTGDEFPKSGDSEHELARSLVRAATLGDDLVMYLKAKILPTLAAAATAAESDADPAVRKSVEQFGGTVEFLEMMFEQLSSEHQLIRRLNPAPDEAQS